MDLSTKNAVTSSVGGFAGGLISGLFGMIGQRRMLRAQQQENLLNFQRNKELAILQNQLNLDQWNRENLYNLPKHQIQRLKDAGLSPALIYQNGATGLQSATSPGLSAGTPSNPVDQTLGGTRKTFGDISQQAMNMAIQARELQMMKSQINKTDKEAEGKDIENKYLPELSESEIAQRLSNANYTNREAQRTEQLIKNDQLAYQQGLLNLKQTIATINNIDADTYSKYMNVVFKEREIDIQKALSDSTIRLNNSVIKINEEQARQMVELFPYVIEGANLDNQKTYSDIMINLATHAGMLSDNEVKAYDAIVSGQKKEFIIEHTGYTNFLQVMDAADKVASTIESVSRTMSNIFGVIFKATESSGDDSSNDKLNKAIHAGQWIMSATM